MQLLLDTHAIIWYAEGNEHLSEKAMKAISAPENIRFISIASLWEMSVKLSLGKPSLHITFDEFLKTLFNQ